MSRITLTIDRLILKGLEPADRTALVEGLQAELGRVLADPADRARWVSSQRKPILRLGQMPFVSGRSGSRDFGTRLAGAIEKGLRP